MRDSVNIIKYWIKELRKIREFQELAKTEDLEFLRLYGETDRALKNLFIETADEYGVKRLEKIAGIYPEAEDTLEQRKARLYVYWNDKEPYTEGELRNRLESLCGAGNYEIISDYKKYLIHIITNVGGYTEGAGSSQNRRYCFSGLLSCRRKRGICSECKDQEKFCGEMGKRCGYCFRSCSNKYIFYQPTKNLSLGKNAV